MAKHVVVATSSINMSITHSRKYLWKLAAPLTFALLSLPSMSCRAQNAAPAPASTTATLLGQSKLQKNGIFTIGGVNLSVLHKSFDWAPAYQRDLQTAPGYPQSSPGSQIVKGTFKTDSGT